MEYNSNFLCFVVNVVFSEEYFSAKYSFEKYFLLDAVNIASLRPFGESGLLRNAVILSATV